MPANNNDLRICSLYKVTNKFNGDSYIGITVNVAVRWRKHQEDAKHCKKCPKFHNALRKYGCENFTWSIIARSSVEGCKKLEQWAIALGMGQYNLTKGGDGTWGYKPSPEAIAKGIATRKGFKMPKEAIAKIAAWHRGRVVTPEARAKISQKLTGCKQSPEARSNMKIAQQHRRGQQTPEERGAHMKKAWETRKANPAKHAETCAKIAIAYKKAVKNRSPERQQAIEEACRRRTIGRKASEETKAKMRTAQEARRKAEKESGLDYTEQRKKAQQTTLERHGQTPSQLAYLALGKRYGKTYQGEGE